MRCKLAKLELNLPGAMDTIEIGIIGMGDMGRLYARTFYEAGWTRINVCDLPEKYEQLKKELPQFNVLKDGHLVSRQSDFILYSIEAKFIDSAVQQYASSTKVGAIVGGQTSVKAPEIDAFEKYLPPDVHIITCHSMHGPTVDPAGQPLAFIAHRASKDKVSLARHVLSSLKSQFVDLSAKEHDRITADTQAVTHLAFTSMGTAWKQRKSFPWADPTYVGGIENIKVAMSLRIYNSKWHVYAGLALLNPFARVQVREYAVSVQELFALMIQEREEELTNRLDEAARQVFGALADSRPILLSERLLDEYALCVHSDPDSPIRNKHECLNGPLQYNSHLSLLAMVDCWARLNLNPFSHLICQTPPFRLLLGMTEFLFRSPLQLKHAINAALYRNDLRADDLAFVTAVSGWAQTIAEGHFDAYQARFDDTQAFFRDHTEAGRSLSSRIIQTVANSAAKGI